MTNLSSYVERLQASPDDLKRELVFPVLLWRPPIALDDAFGGPADVGPTVVGRMSHLKSSTTEMTVHEVRKMPRKGNAFSLGVTVGRTPGNDVVIDDASLSRFHAFFQQDLKSGAWMVSDADSANGTWIGALKLAPSTPTQIKSKDQLRFGSVSVLFLEPEDFLQHLRK